MAFNPSEPTQSLTSTIATVVQKSLDKVMDDLIKVISEHLQQSVNQAVHTSVDNIMDTEVVADDRCNASLLSSGSVVDIVDEYVDRDWRQCNLLVYRLPESDGNDIQVFSDLIYKEFGITSPNITKPIQIKKTKPKKP